MALYKNKEEILIKINIIAIVDLQCTIFWITWRFNVRVDLQCMSIYYAITPGNAVNALNKINDIIHIETGSKKRHWKSL